MEKERDFERNSLILFILMMAANVCNYLFQIIIGNMLSVVDYGVVNTVLSIFGIFSIPTTIITMISARYIALGVTENENIKIYAILHMLFWLVAVFSIVFLFLGLFSQKSISRLFNIDSEYYVMCAVFLAVVNLIFSVTAGCLQGLKKFFQYGIQTVLVASGKLVLSILLILAGWRIYGVVAAILTGTVLAIIYGVVQSQNYMKGAVCYHGGRNVDLREFFRYAIATIIAQGCIIAITNGDILLVKVYFSDTDAGIYSSAMVIGKIAMYVSTAVVAALFPMVVEKSSKKENTVFLLRKALVYGGGMSLICGAGLALFGKSVLSVLFGEKYEKAIAFLPAVCFFVIPLTFVTIIMNYVLAIGKAKAFSIICGIGLAIIIALSLIFHETVSQMIFMCGWVLWAIFAVTVLNAILQKNKTKESLEYDL